MTNILFDDATQWRDNGASPPTITWDGSAYNLITDNTSDYGRLFLDGLLAWQLQPGVEISGHVSWASIGGGGITFSVVLSTDTQQYLIDEVWTGVSGENDFSYAFDGSELPDDGTFGSLVVSISSASGESSSPASAKISQAVSPPPPPPPPPVPTVNCDCDSGATGKTLAALRADLMARLGFAAQADNPPPGMVALLNSFLIEAQEILYRRYDVLRTERFYSWHLQQGVTLYDLPNNDETCTRRLDPRKVTWCGVAKDDTWYPLICGIPPELYSGSPTGWPQRYEIRQCIEVWPKPDATDGSLVIKGHFGLDPFAADTDTTTIDDRLVFLLALANAKAHYGRPDANNYIAQMEQMMVNLVAGAHNTRRYIPGKPRTFDLVYTAPKPTVPFS
jgi:hypothetical protein